MKKEKEKFIDDGRTIANMDIEGLPWYKGDRERHRENVKKFEQLNLTKKERRAIVFGTMMAALQIGAGITAIYFVVLLLLQLFWLGGF